MFFESLGSQLLVRRRKNRLVALATLALVTLTVLSDHWHSRSARIDTSCPATLVNDNLGQVRHLDDGPDDDRQLADFWNHLTTLFNAHPSSPHRLIRPTIDRPSNVDIDAYSIEDADDAFYLTSEQAKSTQRAHCQVLAELEKLEAASSSWHGQGVVIFAGGRYSHIATTTISILRLFHHSRLPVEIWKGNDADEDQEWIEEMRQMGVCVRWLGVIWAVCFFKRSRLHMSRETLKSPYSRALG